MSLKLPFCTLGCFVKLRASPSNSLDFLSLFVHLSQCKTKMFSCFLFIRKDRRFPDTGRADWYSLQQTTSEAAPGQSRALRGSSKTSWKMHTMKNLHAQTSGCFFFVPKQTYILIAFFHKLCEIHTFMLTYTASTSQYDEQDTGSKVTSSASPFREQQWAVVTT